MTNDNDKLKYKGIFNIKWTPARVVTAGILIFLTIYSVSTLIGGFKTVPSGYKGVYTEWGEIKEIKHEGLYWVIPYMGQIINMDTQILKVEAEESTASSDLQEVSTKLAVNYRLKPEYVDEIWRTLRQDYELRVMIPNIEESIKASTAQFIASELITNREAVKHAFLEVLSERLDPYHIEILSVSIVDFQFSLSFTEAIEAKVTAEQKALEALNKLEQVKYEAQQRIIEADASKNATILLAEASQQQAIIISNGTARALLINSEAQAEAIQMIANQLMNNPEYLEYLTILEWDGKLPTIWAGEGDIPFLFMLPSNSTGG